MKFTRPEGQDPYMRGLWNADSKGFAAGQDEQFSDRDNPYKSFEHRQFWLDGFRRARAVTSNSEDEERSAPIPLGATIDQAILQYVGVNYPVVPALKEVECTGKGVKKRFDIHPCLFSHVDGPIIIGFLAALGNLKKTISVNFIGHDTGHGLKFVLGYLPLRIFIKYGHFAPLRLISAKYYSRICAAQVCVVADTAGGEP